MPRDFALTLSTFDVIPKRLFEVFGNYLFFLSLRFKRHSLRAAHLVSGLHESRFSAFLNRADAFQLSRLVFSRALRRTLSWAMAHTTGRLVFIIDTTFQQRQSQALENVHRYYTGTRFVTAHKFINVLVLTSQGPIPLQTIPVYTKKYCRKYHLKYISEYELAASGIDSLKNSELINSELLQKAIFLLDAGFDTKQIQCAIRTLGAHFVVAIKKLRVISGLNVAEYFRRHRHLKWSTIRLSSGSGSKKHGRKYSYRTATNVELRGVGPATVLWSKAIGHAKKPKYLAASDLRMKAREIIRYYAMRWSIELWHRQMKQNYGYIDCHCHRFSAVQAHVQLSVTAYLLAMLTSQEQPSLEQYLRTRDLATMKLELNRFGGVPRLKRLISAAIASLRSRKTYPLAPVPG
jgi:Transposase DDE domain